MYIFIFVKCFNYKFFSITSAIPKYIKNDIIQEEIYKFGKRRNPFNHSTVMMRKSIVQKHGGYAPIRRALDLELFTKLLYQGCKCKNLDKPLVLFRTGNSRVKRKKNWTNLKCDLGVYKRNYKETLYCKLETFLFLVSRR